LILSSNLLFVSSASELARLLRHIEDSESGYPPPRGTLTAQKVKVLRRLTQKEYNAAWKKYFG
jgi:hypothetical protein